MLKNQKKINVVDNLINVFQNDFVKVNIKNWNPYNVKYLGDRLSKLDKEDYEYFHRQIITLDYDHIFHKVKEYYNYMINTKKSMYELLVKLKKENEFENENNNDTLDEIVNEEKENIYDIDKSDSKIDIDNNKIYDKINISYEMKTSSDFKSLFKRQEW